MSQETLAALALAVSAINFLALLWLGARLERRATADATLERRVSLLEQLSNNAPTHRDLEDIRARITTVALDVASVRERLIVNTEMTRSIQKHLMEEEK
jgi:CII-binding regulator of phage lambda lysogenization HflD